METRSELLPTCELIPPDHYAVSYADHVFASSRRQILVPCSKSLGEFAAENDLPPDAVATCDGTRLQAWAEFRPPAGSFITLVVVPKAWVIPWLWTVALPFVLNAAIQAGLGMLWSMAINALFGPQAQSTRPKQSRKDSPTLSGARNELRLFEPIPRVFGRHRFNPPYGASPYTEVVGGDQYLRLLFVVGYGPLKLDVDEMRIGSTPITAFDEIEIETREGFDDDPPLTLFPNTVIQEDLSLTLAKDGGGLQGPFIRTSEPDVDRIGVEIRYAAGLIHVDDRGNEKGVHHYYSVRIRDFNLGLGAPWLLATIAGDFYAPGNFDIGAARRGLFLTGFVILPPYKSRWDVELEITQSTRGWGSPQTVQNAEWIALKSYIDEDPFPMAGVAKVALRIRASDQLSGSVDTFSVLAEAYVHEWDEILQEWKTDWVLSRSPALAYAEVLRGRANGSPANDDQIDGNALWAWHELCVAENWFCDAVIDFRATAFDILTDIAKTGRSTPHVVDGRYSVITERDRSAELPVQLITPRNIISGSFRGTKTFFDHPHAVRVNFINEELDYGNDELIVYNAGYTEETATIFEKIDWWGITQADRAYRDTVVFLKTMLLRPETWVVDMDIENLVAQRGDLVLFSHDVPLLGLSSGRIRSVVNGPPMSVILDERVSYYLGKFYALTVRLIDGTLLVSASVVNIGTSTTEAVESHVVTFASPPSETITPGDLCVFGEAGIETRRAVITEIVPKDDLAASISLTDAADEAFDDSTIVVPPYDPGLNLPPAITPPTPSIQGVRIEPDRIVVSIRAGDNARVGIASYEFQYQYVPFAQWYGATVSAAPTQGLVEAYIPVDGLTPAFFTFRARTVSTAGVASAWATYENYRYDPTPSQSRYFQVANLSLNAQGGRVEFTGSAAVLRWGTAYTNEVLNDGIIYQLPTQSADFLALIGPRFDGFLVRVYRAAEGVPLELLRSEVVKPPVYEYTYEKNVADSAGVPARDLVFDVAVQIDGIPGGFTRVSGINRPPETPALLKLETHGATISVHISTVVTDPDFEGIIVWVSKTTGFTPSKSTQIFKGFQRSVIDFSMEFNTTYFLRYAAYDKFTDDPDALNVSAEYETVTGGSVPDGSVGDTQIDWDDINANSIDRLDADVIAVGTLRADRLILGNYGNMIPDPSFETNDMGNWFTNNGGATGWSLQATCRTGAIGLKYDTTGQSAIGIANPVNHPVAVNPGMWVFFEAYGRTESTAAIVDDEVYVTLRFVDEAGNGVGGLVNGNFRGTGLWQRGFVSSQVPDGATGVLCRIRVMTGATEDAYYFDDLYGRIMLDTGQIVEGAVTASLVDELAGPFGTPAYVRQRMQSYDWGTGPQADIWPWDPDWYTYTGDPPEPDYDNWPDPDQPDLGALIYDDTVLAKWVPTLRTHTNDEAGWNVWFKLHEVSYIAQENSVLQIDAYGAGMIDDVAELGPAAAVVDANSANIVIIVREGSLNRWLNVAGGSGPPWDSRCPYTGRLISRSTSPGRIILEPNRQGGGLHENYRNRSSDFEQWLEGYEYSARHVMAVTQGAEYWIEVYMIASVPTTSGPPAQIGFGLPDSSPPYGYDGGGWVALTGILTLMELKR